MLTDIDNILQEFIGCFKRINTFYWFCIIIVCMLTRQDTASITGMINALALDPRCYPNMLHFFRSPNYTLEGLRSKWLDVVVKYGSLKTLDGWLVCLGDHITVSKDGRYMPGVKKHHQSSESTSKAEYTFGHQHGFIALLAGKVKPVSIAVRAEIHDGADPIAELTNPEHKKRSSIQKMIEQGIEVVKRLQRKSLFVLDAAFGTVDSFRRLKEHNNEHLCTPIALITRAKKNCVAFRNPPPREKGKRGRKRIYGEKVKLYDLFKTASEQFTEVQLPIYSKVETVSYLVIDLIMHRLESPVRYVLVKTGEKHMVLLCSDLTLSAETIILAYAHRFKIETGFKHLKHVLGGFCYKFWTKYMVRLDRWKTQTSLNKCGLNKHSIEKIMETFRAFEVYVMLSCIALGTLSILSEQYPKLLWEYNGKWLRTLPNAMLPSVDVTRIALRNYIRLNLSKVAVHRNLSFFLGKMIASDDVESRDVA
jgi:DDE superfamily endonuclease